MADGASLRESSKEMLKENGTDFWLNGNSLHYLWRNIKSGEKLKDKSQGVDFDRSVAHRN